MRLPSWLLGVKLPCNANHRCTPHGYFDGLPTIRQSGFQTRIPFAGTELTSRRQLARDYENAFDLTGDFCTSRIETGRQKGTWENAEEDVHAGADRAEAAAD